MVTTLRSLCVCVCYTYLCDTACISHMSDIYLTAWKMCPFDCICECAIKASGSRSPASPSCGEHMSVSLPDVGMFGYLRRSLVRFYFNWLDLVCIWGMGMGDK